MQTTAPVESFSCVPWPWQVGHVFNVVNQNGVIRFLDGQPGRVASFGGYKSFYCMRYR
ncbi:toxin glutamine deamidase domain-containing protein [Mycobacterium shinjukuense]|uniref:toxin glutamine deamidase domain-containing protein n=1 Tax=Mycobacterium shinjukuense TaxID=398694 RepID=UPI002F961F13